MLKYSFPATLAILIFVFSAFAQNKFEGFNIILDAPETHRQAACAVRYVPPTTEINISDLNPATPMNVRPCAGSNSKVAQTTASTASMQASASDFKWCFEGEDKLYRISFRGDQLSGGKTIVYDWIPTPEARNLGSYNVRDFGAAGNGRTDDTIAVQSAVAFATTRNGGVVHFPEGDYAVSAPITLASGLTLQGVGSLATGSPTNNVNNRNPSRLKLIGARRALFRMGECTYKVAFRDLELYAESNDLTYGVEAVGAYTSSHDTYFERVTFSLFYRGIYARGLPQTDKGWQFDYVKIKNCLFNFNRDAGIFTSVRNSGWIVEGSFFINPKKEAGQNANSMYFEHCGGALIQHTFGGGFTNARGGTFLNVVDCGNITVLQSQTEAMTNSFIYNEPKHPGHGDYTYPIVFLNSTFGDPIEFYGRRTFVSTGNQYLGNTFKAGPDVRVYSTGDRFCYDGVTLACQGLPKKDKVFDEATVIFMTGQPDDVRGVKGHPTFFGTDVQFGAPVQMPNIRQNQLPNGKPNGSMIYCADCRRSTTPCQPGGAGAPAMVVAGQWSCL